jgi:hypothetical protein
MNIITSTLRKIMYNIIIYNNKSYKLITDENRTLTNNDIRYCKTCNSYHTAVAGKTPEWHKQQLGYTIRFYSPLIKKYSVEDYC